MRLRRRPSPARRTAVAVPGRRHPPCFNAFRRKSIRSFSLTKTFGRSYNADLGDVAIAKKVLNRLGYYKVPSYGMTPYPDEGMFRGIEHFQSRYRLQRDGIMKLGGETASTLGAVLAAENSDKGNGGSDENGGEDGVETPPPLPDNGEPEPTPPSWLDRIPTFPEGDFNPSIPIIPGIIRG